MFYVYAHYLPGETIPFYIGKGKGHRASDRHGRNKLWSLYCKNKFEVKILEIYPTEMEALEAEVKHIQYHRDAGNFLVNVIAKVQQPPYRTGYKMTEAERKVLSDAHLGQLPWNKGLLGSDRRSRPVICVEMDLVFPSIRAAATHFNINSGTIYRACNGTRQTAGGYTWRFQ